ncbi:MAG: hypothetical protein U0441_33885 [Polyangiaceae bacterium]
MQPPPSPVDASSSSAPVTPPAAAETARDAEAAPRRDARLDALAKAGVLLVDLADHATQLATLLSDAARARNLAGGLGRRAELARALGRKLSLFSDSRTVTTTALVNDAVLALDGLAVDVEYGADFASDIRIKNQVARCRLAVVTAGSAINDARHAAATRI